MGAWSVVWLVGWRVWWLVNWFISLFLCSFVCSLFIRLFFCLFVFIHLFIQHFWHPIPLGKFISSEKYSNAKTLRTAEPQRNYLVLIKKKECTRRKNSILEAPIFNSPFFLGPRRKV